MVPVPYRVVWRRPDLADTVTIGIEPVEAPIPEPAPGQFSMLWVFGIGEVPISLSGMTDGVIEHTIRSVGAVTRALCQAGVGDLIGVRGPCGHGWDLGRAEGRDLLIVAGGLGLAPVRPVVLHALAERHRFRRVVLLVGSRDPASLLYTDDLEQWRGRFDTDVEITVDTATPSWRGDVGVVTKLIDRAPIDPATTSAIVCGPEVMMRFTATALLDRGLPATEIQVSLERNMQCAIGHCGHCQLGALFTCIDGPVVAWSRAEPLVLVRER